MMVSVALGLDIHDEHQKAKSLGETTLNKPDPKDPAPGGFNPSDLVKRGFALGTADLLQGGRLRHVVGRAVAFFLAIVRNENDGRLFSGATVLLPPAEATEFGPEAVLAAVVTAVSELRGNPLSEEEAENLARVVRVLHAPSLEVADLIRTLEEQGQNSFIVVAEASRFQDTSLGVAQALGATATRLPEDRWTPHVTALLREAAKAVEGTKRYALVHVNEPAAREDSNLEQLYSVPNTAVFGLALDDDPEEVLAARSADWTSMAVQGRLDEVTAELQHLNLPEATKLHALAYLAVRTGRKGEALALLKQLQPHLDTLVSEVAIQIAQFALHFDDEELANELLPKLPDGVFDPVWLEAGLDAATTLEDNERIAAFDARLGALVPGSAALRENRDRRLLMNCQEAKTGSEQPFTTAGFTEHHLELQMRLSEFEPDYGDIVELAKGWSPDWLELAVVCCAMHARSTERFREAADAASTITSSKLYGRQATQVLLYSIRSMMLRELVPREERDDYRRLFRAVFEYLAHFPSDEGVRNHIISSLSVESFGDQGVPLVALTMLDLVERGVVMPPEQAEQKDEADLFSDDVKRSLENAMLWLGERRGAEPGVARIPRELVVAPPDDVVNAVALLAQRTSGRRGEDVDLEYMERLVLVACIVCPHATQERDTDIRLVRLLAGNLAAMGQFQRARDLAEQMLLMGQSSSLRQRLAWSAYADVYHRGRNYIVALVGMACALATDVAIPKADLWHEVYTIHRILRDLNLFELAGRFLPAMRQLLGDLGHNPETDARIVAAELALQLMQAGESSLEELQALLAKIAAAAESALGDRNQLFPLAILLGQAATKVQVRGGEVSAETRAILVSALRAVGQKVATTVRTVSAEKPSAQDVLAMFNEVQRAAFAADIARDYSHAGLAARRLLDASKPDVAGAVESAFATELLADHAVKLPAEAPKMTVEWPSQYAFELNDAGCDVVFISTDDAGELSVIHVGGRKVVAIEQPRHELTFRLRFATWLATYPRGYGQIEREEGNNVFYLTMERLDIRLPRAERLLIVAEPALQQLTANLVVMPPDGDGFGYLAGTRSSIGAAPSLTWLAAARAAPRSAKTTYKAWISAQLDSDTEEAEQPMGAEIGGVQENDRSQTLDVVLRRLNGTFKDFGFEVDTGRRLPRDMGDAGLAVVTAHGGLSNDGKFLRSIRDDSKLVEAPSALARSLAGVEVVVLFVCSGGRIDKNPWDNSTTSLAKQLLNGGSRAVIASPWPLNVLVTYNWLEPFLRAWEEGDTVLDATRVANDAVAKHFGDMPQYSLAMRVYGDVLLKRS